MAPILAISPILHLALAIGAAVVLIVLLLLLFVGGICRVTGRKHPSMEPENFCHDVIEPGNLNDH